MKLERYEFKSDEYSTTFEFVSEGKNGWVTKKVVFTPMDIPGWYNLAMGDKNPETGNIDDLVVTDNGDMEKVLATVVSIVFSFTEIHPQVWVYATGSTKARNRLYRMLINKHLEIALENFTIYGEYQDQWGKFEKNQVYAAFAAQRKIQ